MPTLTLEEVIAAHAALPDLMAQRGIPPRDAFTIARLAQRLNAEFAAFEEVRQKLIQTYGTEDPKQPGYFNFQGEGREEYNRQILELAAQPVELSEIKVKLSTLGPIAPATLLPLLWLIEDDTAEREATAGAAP